jgi:hypothetical protein
MYKVAILMEGGSGDKAASAEEEAITTPVFLHCLSPFQKILLQICFNDAIISCIIYYISSSFFLNGYYISSLLCCFPLMC